MDTRYSFHSQSLFARFFKTANQVNSFTGMMSEDDIEMNLLIENQRNPIIPLITKHDVQEALNTARESKPHVIEMTHFPRNKINICLLGCHGNKGNYSKRVATFINQIALENPALKPDLFIILGDNYYDPDGLSAPNDPRVEEQFYDTFSNRRLTTIADVPCLVVLGNHDVYCTKRKGDLGSFIPYARKYFDTNQELSKEAGLQQVAHSYLPHRSDPSRISKKEMFQRDKIPYYLLPKHIMPHDFHSWIIGKVQIFALNSNTFAKDFLDLLKGFVKSGYNNFSDYLNSDQVDLNNQVAFTYKNYLLAKKENRKVIFAWHHPLVTFSKRFFHYDAHLYLNSYDLAAFQEIQKLNPEDFNFKNKIGVILENTTQGSNINYNELLKKILYQFLHITPDVISAAHDHSNFYYNNYDDQTQQDKICQVISGTGGNPGKFQERVRFNQRPNLGYFMKESGYTMLTIDKNNPESIEINSFFMDHVDVKNKRHLKFFSTSREPVQEEIKDNDLLKLKERIFSAYESYQIFLKRRQKSYHGQFYSYNSTHTVTDMDIMHKIIGYLNQVTLPNYHDVERYVIQQMGELGNKTSDHSLYRILKEAVLGDKYIYIGKNDEFFSCRK